MILRPAALLLALALALATGARAGIAIHASTERPRAGETFTITLVVIDADGPLVLEQLPVVEGIDIRIAGAPGRRLVNRDGRVRVEDFVVLEFTAHRAGTLELSGLSVAAGRDTWEAPPLMLRIEPAGGASPAAPASFAVEAEARPRVGWLGQGIELAYRLIGSGPVLRCVPERPLEFPGFAAFEWPATSARLSLRPAGSGERWLLSRHRLQAAAPGPKLIPARQFRLALRDGERLGGERVLHAPPLRLEVRPLPAAGRPAGWDGWVGDYLMTAAIDAPRTPAGQYSELRVRLRGEGEPFGAPPRFSVPPGLELRPPRERDLPAVPGRVEREWVFPIRAVSPGAYRLGPLTLAAFSPAQGDYEILSTPVIALEVTGAAAAPGRSAPDARRGRRAAWLLGLLPLAAAALLARYLDRTLRRGPAASALRRGPEGDDPEALYRWVRGGLTPYIASRERGLPLGELAARLAGPAAGALCARLDAARFDAAHPAPPPQALRRILARCRWRRPQGEILSPVARNPAGLT